jgi:hypothetical protein
MHDVDDAARPRVRAYAIEFTFPPGPIFYYGGLYGEIRTRMKYDTTLVTCDRFSTSSRRPRRILRFGAAAFSQLYFWVVLNLYLESDIYIDAKFMDYATC